eukprot:Sspe_Gene.31710::Locus_15612_Transcript_1_1_Confidence_1.000_Length_1351::g.31710::m.31710/K19366/SPG20; spartin
MAAPQKEAAPLPPQQEEQTPASPLDEREATILLAVDCVTVNEVKGRVKNQVDQGTLTILKIIATPEEMQELGMQEAAAGSEGNEVVFLVIGEYKIPLIQSVPVLRQEPCHYTFVMPGLFLELVLPDDVDEEEIEVLELLLRQHGVLRIKGEQVATQAVFVSRDGSVTTAPATVGDRIAGGISSAGAVVVGGITRVTPKVTGGIEKGSVLARGRITQNEVPATVDERTAANVHRTRLMTRSAVVMSGQLANAMVGLARSLGAQLANHVNENPRASNATSNRGVQEAKKVAVASIAVAGNVLDAGTESIKAILTTTCDGLGAIVEHKYGESAGGTFREGLGIVTDVAETGLNMQKVGVKGLAKTVGKETAKNVLNEKGATSSSSSSSSSS